jgi:hypothetical protein
VSLTIASSNVILTGFDLLSIHALAHGSNPRDSLLYNGRAVAQAVSRWLPTAAARDRVRAGI